MALPRFLMSLPADLQHVCEVSAFLAQRLGVEKARLCLDGFMLPPMEPAVLIRDNDVLALSWEPSPEQVPLPRGFGGAPAARGGGPARRAACFPRLAGRRAGALR
ncbi:unnamed protein product [Effrenium voratum]|nr:unnamed protein product [Effrenium voratum]